MRWAANGRWLDGTIIGLLLAAAFLIQTGIFSRPATAGGDKAVAVLFAPWVDAAGAMQRSADAGARIIGLGALPFIAVVEPDRADFAARVTERGALFVLDPRTLAACLTLRRA
jgi:hypothetical protein